MLTFSYTLTNCSKSSLPCLQNDSRIRPLLDTFTATTPCPSPCLPDCLPTDYSSWWLFLCPKPPSVSPCPQNTFQSLTVAHWAPRGPACTPFLTLPSNYAHTDTHTQTDPHSLSSSYSLWPPWVFASPPTSLVRSHRGDSELTLPTTCQFFSQIST